jgi:surface-anchored protein
MERTGLAHAQNVLLHKFCKSNVFLIAVYLCLRCARAALRHIIMKLKSLLTLGITLPFTAQAASLVTGGHIDGPAFGYVSNADVALDPLLTQGFEPHFHNEGGADGAVVDGVVQVDESEFEPGDLIVVVPELSTTTVNSTSYFWLPETGLAAANNGTPFLGIGLEELAVTDWVGGTVSLKLLGITGPGDVLLWQDDGFGGANIFFDGAGDTTTLAAGSHTHYNWGFTETGTYGLEFEISGTHVADGLQSASAVYTFQVVPEPTTAMLGALGSLALLRRRR